MTRMLLVCLLLFGLSSVAAAAAEVSLGLGQADHDCDHNNQMIQRVHIRVLIKACNGYGRNVLFLGKKIVTKTAVFVA